jgi:hypothetical protein
LQGDAAIACVTIPESGWRMGTATPLTAAGDALALTLAPARSAGRERRSGGL